VLAHSRIIATARAACRVPQDQGLLAMQGDFKRHWQPLWVAFSCFIALVVSFLGLWILGRLLVWKASLLWLRPACACIIALAVCAVSRRCNCACLDYTSRRAFFFMHDVPAGPTAYAA
jgi:NO-binding membrane sensor protein with MHYT domain